MPHRANRTFVSNSDALTAWTPFARELLLDTARAYRATVGAEPLAAFVQERSGIRADQPADAWIDRLLDRVAKDAATRGEPPLAALCPRPGDDAAAAAARLECYRAYATDLPADGGTPAPVVRVAPARSARTAAPRAERRPAKPVSRLAEVTCPSCWMIVPVAPTCRSCGEPLPA